GNPGPMGIGVVVIDGKTRRELGDYLGTGTNNIAELEAIARGLDLAADLGDGARARRVRVYSDSGYALGLIGKGWKAKANQELVAPPPQQSRPLPNPRAGQGPRPRRRPRERPLRRAGPPGHLPPRPRRRLERLRRERRLERERRRRGAVRLQMGQAGLG